VHENVLRQIVSILKPLEHSRSEAADSIYPAQPTHSSNDMNSDDIGRVFSMTKKRQSRYFFWSRNVKNYQQGYSVADLA